MAWITRTHTYTHHEWFNFFSFFLKSFTFLHKKYKPCDKFLSYDEIGYCGSWSSRGKIYRQDFRSNGFRFGTNKLLNDINIVFSSLKSSICAESAMSFECKRMFQRDKLVNKQMLAKRMVMPTLDGLNSKNGPEVCNMDYAFLYLNESYTYIAVSRFFNSQRAVLVPDIGTLMFLFFFCLRNGIFLIFIFFFVFLLLWILMGVEYFLKTKQIIGLVFHLSIECFPSPLPENHSILMKQSENVFNT